MKVYITVDMEGVTGLVDAQDVQSAGRDYERGRVMMTEIGMVHATSAALGVPVLMLTGDDAACDEAEKWDGSVATVAVKNVRHRFAAELVPAAAAQKMIESAAKNAIAGCEGQRREPVRVPDPVTLAVRWQSASVAAHLQGIPGVQARDSRTVETAGHMADLWPLFGIFMRVASSLTGNHPYC